MASLKWRSRGVTDQGHLRQLNEDAFLELPESRLWIVADGMGGHEAGDVASQIIVKSFKTFNQRKKFRSLKQMVADAIRRLNRANREMLKLAAQRKEKVIIGSTVVALLTWGSRCAVIWAGDSRVYRCRRKKLQQISKDHSEVQKLVDLGIIDQEHAQSHPASNAITNALGVFKKFEAEVVYDTFKPSDVFLLCSDGLTGELGDYEIIQHFKAHKTRQVADKLVESVLKGSARDNISVMTVWRSKK